MSHIGHIDVLNLPDTVNSIWYDFRLKNMQVINNNRFIAAAKSLFFMYVKYATNVLASNKPQDMNKRWVTLKKIIQAVFLGKINTINLYALYKSEFKDNNYNHDKKFSLQNHYNDITIEILGTNKLQRIEMYIEVANTIQHILHNTSDRVKKYDNTAWFDNAIENLSLSNDPNISNDNSIHYNQPDYQYGVLSDSAATQQSYDWKKKNDDNLTMVKLQQKICNMLFNGENIYKWKNKNHVSDWYCFQEAVKKHKDFMLNRIYQILGKDLNMMNIYDPQYVKTITDILQVEI